MHQAPREFSEQSHDRIAHAVIRMRGRSNLTAMISHGNGREPFLRLVSILRMRAFINRLCLQRRHYCLRCLARDRRTHVLAKILLSAVPMRQLAKLPAGKASHWPSHRLTSTLDHRHKRAGW